MEGSKPFLEIDVSRRTALYYTAVVAYAEMALIFLYLYLSMISKTDKEDFPSKITK